MKQRAAVVGNLAQFVYGLQSADLVVGGHDGNEKGIRIDFPFQRLGVNEALGVGGQILYGKAPLCKALCGV